MFVCLSASCVQQYAWNANEINTDHLRFVPDDYTESCLRCLCSSIIKTGYNAVYFYLWIFHLSILFPANKKWHIL